MSVAVFLLPVLIAIAAALVFVHVVPKPTAAVRLVVWWVLAIVAPWVVYLGANRLARRALPLAALLKMTLVFPDRAPSRLAVVRRAGSTRGLERQLQQSQEVDEEDELSVAAARILALAASLSQHDRMTRGHSERVRALTDLIAEQMKLPTADRDRLRWASLLHDIGKLTVPPSVLNKSGKPDDDEWQVLKGHPLEGKRLVAPLADWLGEWAACVPEHHEKYDGTGYPLGLAGEEISLGGRIVAVADTYDAMTSTRSYSRSVTPAAARLELTNCAGTQFDPVVVRAFLEASVGRLTVVGGPLAWLGELTSANGVSQVGQVVGAAGHALAGVAAVVGVGLAVVVGAHHAPDHPVASHTPTAVGRAAPTGHPAKGAGGARPALSFPDPPVAPAADPPQAPARVPGGGGTGDPPPAPSDPTTDPTTDPPDPTTTTTTTTTTSTASPASSPVSAPTAPGAPRGGAATAGNAAATVTWTAPDSDGGSPVTGYTVTATDVTTPPDGGQTCTWTSGPLTCTVTGLVNGDTYTFTTRAANAVGSGPNSAATNPVTPVTVPGVPRGVAAVAGEGSSTVTWSPPASDGGSPVTGYRITPYIGLTAQAATTVGDVTTDVIGGLVDGDTYSFTVTALNSAGYGSTSGFSDAVTPATVPDAPGGVAGSPGDAAATVTWSAPVFDGGSPLIGFTVTATDLTAPANGGQTCLWVSGPLTCTVSGLVNGDAYTFVVTATNAEGTGPPSPASVQITPVTVPGAPQGVTAGAGDATATVTWSAPDSDGGSPVTGYQITTYSGLTALGVTAVGDVTSDVVGGLSNGETYSFTVTAVNAVGTGGTSGFSDAVTPATVPGPPGIGTATATGSAATVTWSSPASDGGSPITGYTVTASDLTTPGNGGQTCAWTTGPLTCTVPGLVDGDSYTFSVTATNTAGTGTASPASNPVTPLSVPGAPLDVVATPGDATATVTWSAPASDGGSTITGYTVTAGDLTTPGNGGQTCTWTAGPLSCSLAGLTNGDSYTFSVTATTAFGTGTASGPSNQVTPATVPDPPTIVSTTPGVASVTVSWTPPASDGGSPITGYTVVAGDTTTPTNGGESCTWTSGPLTCTVTGLTLTDSYIFGASATNAVGTSATSTLTGPVLPVSMVIGGRAGIAGLVGQGLLGPPGLEGRTSAGDRFQVIGTAQRPDRRVRRTTRPSARAGRRERQGARHPVGRIAPRRLARQVLDEGS